MPLVGDQMHEECGVFGIYGPAEDVARLTFFGLYALQHRGQESAGIVTAAGSNQPFNIHRGMGLVAQVFQEKDLQQLRVGTRAIGHVRYSTSGSSTLKNAQPLVVDCARGQLAIAHNGNLVNAAVLREVPAALAEIPHAALATVGGGTVVLDPARTDGKTDQLRPLEPLFHFDLRVTGGTLPARLGARVHVRFDHGYEPLAYRFGRGIR